MHIPTVHIVYKRVLMLQPPRLRLLSANAQSPMAARTTFCSRRWLRACLLLANIACWISFIFFIRALIA